MLCHGPLLSSVSPLPTCDIDLRPGMKQGELRCEGIAWGRRVAKFAATMTSTGLAPDLIEERVASYKLKGRDYAQRTLKSPRDLAYFEGAAMMAGLSEGGCE